MRLKNKTLLGLFTVLFIAATFLSVGIAAQASGTDPGYLVLSAGPDGILGTEDDLWLTSTSGGVQQGNDYMAEGYDLTNKIPSASGDVAEEPAEEPAIEGTLLHDEAPGTVITFSGKEWVVLEQKSNGETYIITAEPVCQRAFDPDDTQLFNPNDSNNIAYYLNNSFYNSLSQKELIAEHTWDRVSVNCSDRKDGPDRGDVTCKVGLLSYREYEKYSLYYNGDILPDSYSYWWWTRTPRTEYSSGVWYVYATGYLNGHSAFYTSGSVRPALYLKSGTLIDENKVVVGSN